MGTPSFTITSKTSRKFYKKTRKVKDLDNENFRWGKTQEYGNNPSPQTHTHSWIYRINIMKVIILLKAIYRFKGIPIKIYITVIIETEK